jgi:hypothetical protein
MWGDIGKSRGNESWGSRPFRQRRVAFALTPTFLSRAGGFLLHSQFRPSVAMWPLRQAPCFTPTMSLWSA